MRRAFLLTTVVVGAAFVSTGGWFSDPHSPRAFGDQTNIHLVRHPEEPPHRRRLHQPRFGRPVLPSGHHARRPIVEHPAYPRPWRPSIVPSPAYHVPRHLCGPHCGPHCGPDWGYEYPSDSIDDRGNGWEFVPNGF